MGTPECASTFVGKGHEGASCSYDVECDPSTYCRMVSVDICGGTCTPRLALGMAGDPYAECVAPAESYFGVCVLPLAEGQVCDPADGGDIPLPCALPASCLIGGYDGGASICVILPERGQPCAPTLPPSCGPYAFCNTTMNQCVGLAGVGAPCTRFNCELDLFCDISVPSGACRPRSALGGPCIFAEDCLHSTCSGTVFINPDGGLPVAGTCLALPGLGDSCDQSQCDTGLFCDPFLLHCVALLDDGAACLDPSRCKSASCATYDGGVGTCGFCR
jgi:hypothetical protein